MRLDLIDAGKTIRWISKRAARMPAITRTHVNLPKIIKIESIVS
ncbi:MAG TPA: hypothetical protein VH796_09215 [Nitrososphaeraceae archaeon]|jgi:hypothetical protein